MQHLSEIVEEARKKGKKRLAVAYGQDAHTLAAVYAAYKEGLVEPILFGDPKIIEQVCKEENIDCNIFKIIPESNDVKCVNLAVNAVVTGEADVLMKGLVSTDKYMRGILNKDAGLFPPKGTLSHVAVVEMPNYPKLLVISDVAVIPQPDFKQKTILIGYLTRIANLIGIKTPKIACIAPSEQLLPSVLSSTEAALLAKMGDRGQLGNVVIDGKDLASLSSKELRQLRQQVSMIFQHFNLLSQRDVRGNISFAMEIAGMKRPQIEKRIDELLEIVGLTDRQHNYPSQLSGVASAMPGYNLIFTIRHGTGDKRKQNTVFADALHRVHHGFIVDHLERMIFEWHELIQRYLADFLQTRILTAGFRREQIDAGFQAYAAGIKCHARSPPAPASHKRAQPCLSHYAHRCCIQAH